MNQPIHHLVQDWQKVKDKINTFSWADDIVRNVKTETDWWVANYKDDPERVAGWMHHYFCKECSVQLVFDASKPEEHVCSRCSKSRQDDEANNAWSASYRSRSSRQVFNAAVLYNLYGDPAYLTLIRQVLAFYSDHLQSFIVDTPRGYEGRFSGINLSDAVNICWMLNGMELVKQQFTEAELDHYSRYFFFPMADFLHHKKGGTPNICCWMKSALGMIGLFFNEHDWCRLAAEGEEGIQIQLSTGLLPEGFWYESSFHYHFYAAEGLTYYAAFCKLYDYDFAGFTDAIRSMYRYPTKYSFSNGQFPSPNDGWPLLSFANYAHQYEWIRNMFDEAPFRYALAQSYDSTRIGGLPRLLFGTDWHKEMKIYEQENNTSIKPIHSARYDKDIHYALLQNEQASVFLKYGFVIGGHSHADIMNFELYVKDEIISRDISNSGYGSDLFREWQRKSIAHNTVMVDGKNQPRRPRGQMLEFDSQENHCRVTADDVYPGVRYTRGLQLYDDRLQDEFSVAITESHPHEHTIDWLFHCSGELECGLPLQKVVPPGEEDGYQLMQDVQSCETDEDWEMSWVLPNKKLTLAMAGCPGTTVYIFKGYEHSSDLLRWGVMVRRTGDEANFNAVYRFQS